MLVVNAVILITPCGNILEWIISLLAGTQWICWNTVSEWRGVSSVLFLEALIKSACCSDSRLCMIRHLKLARTLLGQDVPPESLAVSLQHCTNAWTLCLLLVQITPEPDIEQPGLPFCSCKRLSGGSLRKVLHSQPPEGMHPLLRSPMSACSVDSSCTSVLDCFIGSLLAVLAHDKQDRRSSTPA